MAGRFVVTWGDETRAVDVSAGGEVTVSDADAPLQVRPLGGHQYEAVRDSARTRLFAVASGAHREVFVDGRVYRLEVASADERRPATGAGHADQPTAPMPGTVVKLLVEVGQHVERGHVLLKLEAMKMEMPIRATHRGTVVAIHCREGELVQAGTVLLQLKADGQAE